MRSALCRQETWRKRGHCAHAKMPSPSAQKFSTVRGLVRFQAQNKLAAPNDNSRIIPHLTGGQNVQMMQSISSVDMRNGIAAVSPRRINQTSLPWSAGQSRIFGKFGLCAEQDYRVLQNFTSGLQANIAAIEHSSPSQLVRTVVLPS